MKKRVFLIVLDSFGAGAAPDAADFGDSEANTLGSIAGSPDFACPNLLRLGLSCLDGVSLPVSVPGALAGSFARLRELSRGKDTTIGHWELAGLVSPVPLPTYPEGFPASLIDEFSRRTGRSVLCNKPYSGTEVLRDYGEEHLRTGALIVYTSADSVFQIAAHEDVVPPEQLYECCRIARSLLTGEHSVGRVIAQPFEGTCRENFRRTPRRHDFSLPPPSETMLDFISGAGLNVTAVGKINDIFAGRGVTRSIPTQNNEDGQRVLLELARQDFCGLAFVNLVDFDMLYGHRRDVQGYARAASSFDRTLGKLLPLLQPDDLLLITADHGCDPAYLKSTDHTREYVPLLIFGGHTVPGRNLGTLAGFHTVADTICDYLGVPQRFGAGSILTQLSAAHCGARTPELRRFLRFTASPPPGPFRSIRLSDEAAERSFFCTDHLARTIGQENFSFCFCKSCLLKVVLKSDYNKFTSFGKRLPVKEGERGW